MENPRRYGKAPFTVAVVHGGPGAAGEMAPVARVLSSDFGVLEPIQTATTVQGQVQELRQILEESGDLPIKLIGFSWGAWLSFIFAASFPSMVQRLILIGSGPYEERYAEQIARTRLCRLGIGERSEVESIMISLGDSNLGDSNLGDSKPEGKDLALARMGALLSKADSFDPIECESDVLDCRADIFQGVWNEAADLRLSGKLLGLGRSIQCPVVAIHGDYDPHPAEGVQLPLNCVLKRFRFILIKNCGHKPWIERGSREIFYRILREELLSSL
jgi:pimeloyl-ACP methyl ester carboxylesterase